MTEQTDRIPEIALTWHRAGRGAALCTVIETWGSAPRRTGAQMVVDRAGAMEGSVSGGCVEGAVVLEAQAALSDGGARVLEFGVSDGDAFAVGLACGGRIRVLVDPVGGALPEPVLTELVDARAARRPVAYLADLAQGSREVSAGDPEMMRRDRSGFLPESEIFHGCHPPPLRLVIVGAVHIAQALVPMARMAGFTPLVLDARESFATEARFPGTNVRACWPGDALAEAPPDARTALVLLTHDPKIDDPALEIGLASEAFYIGALGSTRTQESRRSRMREAGFDSTTIARIHGPVGLDIGAATPAEIAVSILAEMIAVLRGRADGAT